MKRKMLISIALVLIMLLNCMMPLFRAYAVTGEEIQLNSKLYAAVKSQLSDRHIVYTADDITHTITISPDEKAKVTELDLNEGGISDIAGLEAFSSLTHIELSGNNLTSESHLSVLNSFDLDYLDLSTNKIADVSAIDQLIDKMIVDGKTVILSGQTVTVLYDVTVDVSNTSNNDETRTFDFPAILERAGFIKACWRHEEMYSEGDASYGMPSLKTMSNPVTANNRDFEVRIADTNGNPYLGLYALEIYIYDDRTEAAAAANLNPAATNMLHGCRFYIYVVVHDNYSTAISMLDSNLYRAVKEQLTAGQTVNDKLESYPYAVDAAGNTIYDECVYMPIEIAGYEDRVLYALYPENKSVGLDNSNVFVAPSYIYDATNGKIYLANVSGQNVTLGEFYTSDFEKVIIPIYSDNGLIQQRQGIRFAHNGTCRNLYKRAYDIAKTFVITNVDLVNKIHTLILNNKEIRELDGIEKFIGLVSNLNVSHNYLDNIDPIYELQKNKRSYEAIVQKDFNKYLSSSSTGNLTKSYNAADSSKKAVDNGIKQIASVLENIYKKLIEASKVEPLNADGTTNQNYDKTLSDIAEAIDGYIDQLYGHTEYNEATNESTWVEGLISQIQQKAADATADLRSVQYFIDVLYTVYNNDYKLATILTKDLNYLTIDEYEAYKDKAANRNSAISMYNAEVSRLAGYDSKDQLSDLERRLLNAGFNVPYPTQSKPHPVSEHLKSIDANSDYDRIYVVNRLNAFREIALYAEMDNYCLINRIVKGNTIPEGYNFAADYLKMRIEKLSYEGIDTSLEEAILYNLEKGIAGDPDSLYGIFYAYEYGQFQYFNEANVEYDVDIQTGPYKPLDRLRFNNGEITDVSELNGNRIDVTDTEVVTVWNKLKTKKLPKDCKLVEVVNTDYEGDLQLYRQLMSLAGKFVSNSGEVSRYITLEDLKRLDISYNAYLQGIERLSELDGLRELYAGYDYITDLSETDWAKIKYLRKLDLSYNYIHTIKPLEVLENIEYLDVSHNLLSGTLNFNFTNSQKKLKDLNLSYNQLEDIRPIMELLDFRANGNDGNYLARTDTLNIDLGYQTIKLNLDNPIYLSEYPHTINIDLPIIFTQLLAIDVERTGLGLESLQGRIESEGKYVTLITETPGQKEGYVVVLPMSGNGEPVEHCVGEGTKAIVKYNVVGSTVESITIEPGSAEMKLAESKQFTARLVGDYIKDTTVTWSVSGNTSSETVVSSDGILTIGADEQAAKVKVIVTSNQDSSATDYAEVTISENKDRVQVIESVDISPSSANVKKGTTRAFIATVNGQNVTDPSVTWIVTGNLSNETKIDANGTLTIAANESSPKVKVTATSNADNTKFAYAMVTVLAADDNSGNDRDNQNVAVTVSPSSNVSITKGSKQQFTAKVTGTNLTDNTVTWKITGNESENTTVSEDGLVTIGSDETANAIIVVATSNADPTVKKSINVTLKAGSGGENPGPGGDNPGPGGDNPGPGGDNPGPGGDNPGPGGDNPGPGVTLNLQKVYKIEDEYIKKVAPKTPVSAFKTNLLNDSNYVVVIKKDGQTITDGYMKTGMYIQIQDKNGNVVVDTNGHKYVYEAIVTGDVNGDGLANSFDSLLIKGHRNEVKTQSLIGEYLEAADIDFDNDVDADDSRLLLYHRAEVKNYNLNYNGSL